MSDRTPGSRMVDWSCGLPQDLLVSILQRLPLRDCIRSGAVCVAWRSLAAETGYPPQHPWLVLPRSWSDELNESHNFYSLFDKQGYKIHLPGVRWFGYLGASEGWFIIQDEEFQVSLLNPLTRAQIQLPPFPATFTGARYLLKAALSWNSVSSYTVVVLCYGYSTLAFTRAGDEAWTMLELAKDIYGLVHFTQLFYIKSSMGWAEALDLTGSSPKFTPIAVDWRDPNELWNRNAQLVESSGDLFQLVRKTTVVPGYYKTIGFEVFKLDPIGTKWVQANTLGNCTVFLGHDLPMSLSTQGFPGLKGNCIHFVDDQGWDDPVALKLVPDLWVFDYDEGSIETYYPDDSHLTCPIPIWFVPNLS